MGVLFGLLTALAWGSSDFSARFAARRIGSLRTTLYMQFTGLILLTLCLRWVGGWGHLFDGSGWQPWAWGVLAGIFNGVASLALYRSFEVGKMSVVAPLSASYPALTVALSFFSGERLTALRIAGIVLIVAGVIFVARGESAAAPTKNTATAASAGRTSDGVSWAFVSAVGFGILFWLLGIRIVPAVGFAATVWMIRLTSSMLTAAVVLAGKQTLVPPREMPVAGLLLSMGILDTGAFILNNRGMQLEQVSVVSVLASLYGAVTVLLAAIFLRERLARWQWLGIAAIFAGIALISR
ncbi:MAG TPA: EamA family transporter [Candidatus Eisenbacteria bacterium]|jgi:drug/metabolite transporter (DMT)-like permease|nr:EamA family transporter [Candidatus Eisenbacteria bacterium]